MTKLIYPVFIKEGQEEPIHSPLLDLQYHSIKSSIDEIEECLKFGLNNFLIIGVPKYKNFDSIANLENIACQSILKIKDRFGEKINIFGDVCLSPYQENGHSMILENSGKVNKEQSLKYVLDFSLNLAKSGADFIAPVISLANSTKEIRELLDRNNLEKVKLMPYSAKFASSFYSPYRETIESPLTFGGKEIYQIDPSDKESAIKILVEDSKHADILMIKPGLPYLDILVETKQIITKPIAMYQVSAEYQMLKIVAKEGVIDWDLSIMEIFHCFQRAQADYLISYAAKDIAKKIN
jgi:porphobilinogen synthase